MSLKRRSRPNLNRLRTETTNPASTDLDQKSAIEIAAIINAEDAKVAGAVKRGLPQIARAIDLIASSLRQGGRLIYVGSGTSGRLGALDASEIPPTFDTDPRAVQYIIAGGPAALAASTEASEDSRELGRSEMAKKNPPAKTLSLASQQVGEHPSQSPRWNMRDLAAQRPLRLPATRIRHWAALLIFPLSLTSVLKCLPVPLG